MKRITAVLQALVLLMFFLVLGQYFWFEEVLLLSLLTFLTTLLPGGVILLTVKVVKKSRSWQGIRYTLIAASVLQLVLCLFVFWSVQPKVFSREQVLGDIDHGVALMKEIHPDLHARMDEVHLAAHIDSLKNALSQEVTENELLKTFASITHKIGDAHTEVDLDNFVQRGSILFKKVPPCLFKIKNEQIHIQKNYYFRDRIPVGSQVVSINNKPAAQCLAEVRQLISFETGAYRDAWLQLPIFWGLWNNNEEFTVAYLAPDHTIGTVTTSSGLLANLRYLWDFTAGYGFENYEFETLDHNIGYIDFQAFADIDEFRSFAKNTFAELKDKGVENLIIDLRRNSGGRSDVSEEMMQYLSPVAFASFDTSQIKISEYLLTQLTPSSRTYIDSLGFGPGSLMTEDFSLIPLRDNPLRYSGRCFVLTSGFSFSSALDFAAMVRHYGAGQIVGSETGGRTVSFGSPIQVTMPQTGVILKISFKRFVNAGGHPSSRGLIPDFEFENSLADDIAGVDRVLESALALMREEKP